MFSDEFSVRYKFLHRRILNIIASCSVSAVAEFFEVGLEVKNCPGCNEKPISLVGWCSGINSIKCICKSCGTALSANVTTWVVLLAIVVAMYAVAYTSVVHFDVQFKQDRLLIIGLTSIPVLAGSLLGYMIGGYEIKKVARK
ncbi:hypothetical protein GCM10027180_14570 [Microbulbifer echini]